MIRLPRIRHKAEAVEMRSRRWGYFPRTFVWRGTEHQVEAIQRVWTTLRGGETHRHYFHVRCADGEFTLYQDLRHNTWHIQL